MESKTFQVPNISCHHCVMAIQRELSALEGVKRVKGLVEEKRVTVEWEAPATWDQIVATLTDINYPPT
jgi:copper chaperone CopZ